MRVDAEHTADGASPPVLDRSVLRGIPGFGSVALLDRLSDLFLGEGRVQLDHLARALGSADAEAVRQAAHRLKSSSGAIGARRVALCAERLEQQARDAALTTGDAQLAELRRELEAAGEALAALRGEVAA